MFESYLLKKLFNFTVFYTLKYQIWLTYESLEMNEVELDVAQVIYGLVCVLLIIH